MPASNSIVPALIVTFDALSIWTTRLHFSIKAGKLTRISQLFLFFIISLGLQTGTPALGQVDLSISYLSSIRTPAAQAPSSLNPPFYAHYIQSDYQNDGKKTLHVATCRLESYGANQLPCASKGSSSPLRKESHGFQQKISSRSYISASQKFLVSKY